jgi:hypothetical protein
MTMNEDDGREPNRFSAWFWRPSWDANLPDDPQARYFARKEHNRRVRRVIGLVIVLIIVSAVITHALTAQTPYQVYYRCLANGGTNCVSPSP